MKRSDDYAKRHADKAFEDKTHRWRLYDPLVVAVLLPIAVVAVAVEIFKPKKRDRQEK